MISASSTSTRLPRDTKPLTPRRSAAAISRKAAPTVPLWEAKAILPLAVIRGLEAHAVGAGLGEAAGDDDGGLDAFGGALFQSRGDNLRRYHHHRQRRGGG